MMSQQSISVSNDGNGSSVPCDFGTSMNPMLHHSSSTHHDPQNKAKKKRNSPGNPHPDSEVVALSPRTLMATHRFVCEVCNKGFQRDQNLQLHRRGHNLPWKLKQRSNNEKKKKVFICPEISCVHHLASRALGDLTGIKKHFFRKHGEKKWKCDMCAKVYAVESDLKMHTRTCRTKEYRCHCGTLFTRQDSFVTHMASCDALAEKRAKVSINVSSNSILPSPQNPDTHTDPNANTSFVITSPPPLPSSFLPFSSLHYDYPNTWEPLPLMNPHNSPAEDEESYIPHLSPYQYTTPATHMTLPPFGHYGMMPPPPLSATMLLQKAASTGVVMGRANSSSMAHLDVQSWAHTSIGADVGLSTLAHTQMQPWTYNSTNDGFTRDFMGLGDHFGGGVEESSSAIAGEMIPFGFNMHDRDRCPVLHFSNPAWKSC